MDSYSCGLEALAMVTVMVMVMVMVMMGDETAFLPAFGRDGKPRPMITERGVRNNAMMIVFLQVAITIGNGRNPKEMMHDCDPSFHGDPVETQGHFFSSCRQRQILKLGQVPCHYVLYCRYICANRSPERVGAGMSFRPLKAASVMVAPTHLWLALQLARLT